MWTDEEDDELRFLRSREFDINEVGELFMPNRTLSSIAERYKCIYNEPDEKDDETLVIDKVVWTDEELLKLVRKYKFATVYREKALKPLPYISVINARFDGWKNAAKAAGLLREGGMDPSEQTTLYLVKFVEEGFLRLGLTQMPLELSLRKFPKYEILFEAKYDYQTAKAKKLEWLEKLAPYKYTPKNPRLDNTQCFKLAPDSAV